MMCFFLLPIIKTSLVVLIESLTASRTVMVSLNLMLLLSKNNNKNKIIDATKGLALPDATTATIINPPMTGLRGLSITIGKDQGMVVSLILGRRRGQQEGIIIIITITKISIKKVIG
jgi:hypothetical protein